MTAARRAGHGQGGGHCHGKAEGLLRGRSRTQGDFAARLGIIIVTMNGCCDSDGASLRNDQRDSTSDRRLILIVIFEFGSRYPPYYADSYRNTMIYDFVF